MDRERSSSNLNIAAGDPIRVLAFLDDIVISGNVKPVLTLARCARTAKDEPRPLEVTMVAFSRTARDPDLITSLQDEGFTVDVVRENGPFDFAVFAQLHAIVDRRQPDVLWTHGAKTHFLVRLAGLARGRTWVASHHGYTAPSLRWRLYDQLDRWSLRAADCVMTPCDAFAADLNARIGIRRERLSVHRTPITVRNSETTHANVALRKELDLPPDARIVLSVGRLSKEKGHADLIRAMPYVRQMRDSQTVLVIVGDGPERTRLESLCARLGVAGAVHMVGYQRDVTAYYGAADVFALTSHTEGSPNVLLEAMDARVPIVATAVGGIGEMIQDGQNGLLVRSGDVEGIARAVVTLLDNTEMGLTLAAHGRESLAAYSPERYYGSIRSVFEKIVAS